MLRKIRPSFLPAIAWLIISTVLLTLPGSAFPSESWLDKIYFDKWVHIGMFCVMTVSWCWACTRFTMTIAQQQKTFIWIAVASLAYGVGMEFVQRYLVINRSFDGNDIIADAAGCVLGFWFSNRYIKK